MYSHLTMNKLKKKERARARAREREREREREDKREKGGFKIRRAQIDKITKGKGARDA